jgi:predicted permease
MRVRTAKFFLRGINFACSLIVLSMLSTTFSIFNATRALPPRNNLPPWASSTKTWPQILLLCIACVSLFMAIIIFWGYLRGGHRRAEKVAVYYTTFAVFFFVFSIVMWGVGAAVLNQSRVNGNGQDIWGWSCKDNTRRALFQNDIGYALICRLQVRPAPDPNPSSYPSKHAIKPV